MAAHTVTHRGLGLAGLVALSMDSIAEAII